MNKKSKSINQLLVMLVFLAAGAGVVAVGVFLLWPGSQTGDVTPNASPARLEDDRGAFGTIGPGAVGVFDDDPASFDEQPPEDLVRIDLPAQGNNRFLFVQVWDGESGAPAAEADVFFLDGFEGPELTDPFAQHWSDLAERRGERYKADSQGRIELPTVEDWAMVTAQRPGAYGFARMGREHRDVETITLRPDETVTVRVADNEDRPVAGVPVGVVQHVPVQEDPAKLWEQMQELQRQKARVEEYIRDNPAQREAAQGRVQGLQEREVRLSSALRKAKEAMAGDKDLKANREASRVEKYQPPITVRTELRARRYTDAEGIAVFRHFQVYRREHEEWWPAHHIDKFEAVLLMPLQQPEARAFTGRPVSAETLKLRMPPTGSIALRTVDHDGRPFTHPVHAELRMDHPEAEPWTRLQVRKEQNEETITFPFVGLGLWFDALCRLDDDDFRWSLQAFAGPNHPGERITLDMLVAPEAGMLFGRLLDGSGKPLAGARPTFMISSHAGRLEGEEVPLDTGGRFHLPYKVREPHSAPFRLEIRRDDVSPTAGLAMTLPALPEGRVTDLGDLRIDSFARLARGTVADDQGLPIEGATVQLQREREVGGKQPRLEFVNEDFTLCRTDAEGRYELFGEIESGRYRLRAEAQDHFPVESGDLRQGDPVDLTLQRKARVVGTVLTPSWMPSRSIRVRLVSTADPQQQRDDQVHDHEGKTYIYFDWVRPGIYNVLIRTQDFPDPFLRVDRLEVLPGQQDLHPRLQDLDLGLYLYRFDVSAVDEQGRPIQPNRPLLARIVRPGGAIGFVGFPWRNGRAEILSASPHLDVWPEALGYHAEPTVLADGQSELRFLKIPAVEVHVPGLRQLIGTMPAWIGLTLAQNQEAYTGFPDNLERWDRRSGRIAGWYGKSRSSYAELGEDEIARVELARDGLYQVVAYLGGRKVRLDFGAAEVRLEPGAKPQRVTVTIDTVQVQAALDEGAQQGAAK